ncbi:ATP-binding protein [Suttonella sp. R2A3]|uniref:ATP-binding protein n=1 Tax=Suttonella sp. R2A3 TaxID=2908648 RepID=UPI001F16ED72|nr:ATP-binding protein [Suttonella sp. R2A3]UJF24171.1 ATP-binding protein [Suttonella sp. R2A3]
MSSRYLSTNRLVWSLLAGGVCILLTLSAVYGLSNAALNQNARSNHYIALLIAAVIGLGILVVVVIWQIYIIIRHLRKRQSGARLTASFALSMLTAALLPVMIIAYFSWQFLSYDLDKTFNSRVSTTLNDALQLTREAITLRARQALDDTRELSDLISGITYGELINNIEAMRRNNNAIMLAVFDHQGNVVGFAHRNLSVMTVPAPSPQALSRANEEREYFEFSSHDDEYSINVISNINKLGREPFYLQAVYAMPESFNSIAQSVRQNYRDYQTYNYLQPHITTSLLLVLILIFSLTVLFIFWLSVLFGEHMTQPLRSLIRATRRIADGDYTTQVKNLPRNDLGALGANFNRMSAALGKAQTANEQSQRLLAEQKSYLETLMDNITAGVIVLNAEQRIQTFNPNAEQILGCSLDDRHTPPPESQAQDACDELLIATAEMREQDDDHWQQQVTLRLANKRTVLMCRGSRVQDNVSGSGVDILVFDDITDFIHSQRNAAWEEVARRLAHEIKNPLTPIQLQGERLQLKLSNKLSDEADQRILQRATDTIIKQVEAMKTIVSDFSQFARPIELRRQSIDLNALLQEMTELYPEHDIRVIADPSLPQVSIDPVQLRQVFLNLTKNALEAAGEDAIVEWSTQQNDHGDIIMCVADNGAGFSDFEQDPFEPYVTGKSKGTGLGLAIVKKIIQEHNGHIAVSNSSALGGAKITITLAKQ